MSNFDEKVSQAQEVVNQVRKQMEEAMCNLLSREEKVCLYFLSYNENQRLTRLSITNKHLMKSQIKTDVFVVTYCVIICRNKY
jgi:hypothetical protein